MLVALLWHCLKSYSNYKCTFVVKWPKAVSAMTANDSCECFFFDKAKIVFKQNTARKKALKNNHMTSHENSPLCMQVLHDSKASISSHSDSCFLPVKERMAQFVSLFSDALILTGTALHSCECDLTQSDTQCQSGGEQPQDASCLEKAQRNPSKRSLIASQRENISKRL